MFGRWWGNKSGYKLVCGLGNPGLKYAHTRHNVGYQVVARIAQQAGAVWSKYRELAWTCEIRLDDVPVILVQPMTFMNLSGGAVQPLARKHRIAPENLMVVGDDLDLAFGTLRLRPSGSAGGHRGIQSVIEQLGSQQFPRLRVGIGRPTDDQDPAHYVLQPFPYEEREHLQNIIDQAVIAVDTWVREGIDSAMNRCNQRRHI